MKKILIEYIIPNSISPISTVNRSIISGLNNDFVFIPFKINQRYNSKLGELTIRNIFNTVIIWFKWALCLLKFRPDIAHYTINSYWAFEKSMLYLLTAKVFGVKIVGHLHGGAFKTFLKGLTGLRKEIAYKMMNRLDGIITLSPSWQNFIDSEFQHIKSYHISNPIDINFENKFINFTRNYDNDNILFVGDLVKRKGIFDILTAINSIKNIHVKFAGYGDYNSIDYIKFKNEIIVNYLSNQVTILGTVTGDAKIKVFQEAGIFILPSYVENFPLVVIEAACAGLPIIATKIGALPDVFTHNENILFIEPGDVGQLVKYTKLLLLDRNERQRLGLAARKIFIHSLNRDDIMKKFKWVYDDLLSDR